MEMDNRIINFNDLKAWQTGHQVILLIYQETKIFPREEQFGLISQLRRASISITSNIAEGFSRKTAKDKIYFYSISLGSLTEVQNQLLIAKDLEYLKLDSYLGILQLLVQVQKMLHGLIKSASNRP